MSNKIPDEGLFRTDEHTPEYRVEHEDHQVTQFRKWRTDQIKKTKCELYQSLCPEGGTDSLSGRVAICYVCDQKRIKDGGELTHEGDKVIFICAECI